MRAAVVPLVLGASLALFAAPAFGAGYATDDSGNLFRVFPGTKEVEKIGTVQVPGRKGGKPETPSLTDIALHHEHGLFGISYSHLYKINLREPGKSKRIGPLGGDVFTTFNALAFDDDGVLYLAGGSALYTVDIKTGKAALVGEFGAAWFSDGDLSWIDDTLYATVNGSKGCLLATIDVKTGKAKAVGYIRIETEKRTRIFADVWGLIWDGRVLWALTPNGQIVELDRKTAIAKAAFVFKVTFWGACGMIRI